MKKTITTHNIRIGKDQRHNDRNFENRSEEGHIDFEKEKQNFYWHCQQNDENVKTFLEAEKKFYEETFGKSLEEQNKKYEKRRQKDRIKTMDEVRTSKKFCPVESIFEIGNSENRTDGNETLDIFMELKERLETKFKNLHIIDYALHVDEKGNDHIHWRSIISYTDEKGIRHIGQEKGLEQMGIQLPDPTKKASRHNNRKMTFDKEVREMTAEIAKELYDYDLEKSESPGGMRLDDYRSWKEAKDKVKEEEKKLQEISEKRKEEEQKERIAKERAKNAKNIAENYEKNADKAKERLDKIKKKTDQEIAYKLDLEDEIEELEDKKNGLSKSWIGVDNSERYDKSEGVKSNGQSLDDILGIAR